MKFLKYHCLGNDYLILITKNIELTNISLQPKIVRRICNRNFGIGADGILVGDFNKKNGLFSLHIYNSDGSLAEKSGNGFLRPFGGWRHEQSSILERAYGRRRTQFSKNESLYWFPFNENGFSSTSIF